MKNFTDRDKNGEESRRKDEKIDQIDKKNTWEREREWK